MAAANMNRVKGWEGASLDMVLKTSHLNRKLGRYDRALRILVDGGKALGGEAFLYPEMKTVHKEAGSARKAASVFERCSALEDDAIRKRCREATGETVSSSQNEIPGMELIDKFKNSFLSQ